MLAMSDIICIKLLRNNKGLSITKIQELLKINWRTAKKYADGEQLPKERKKCLTPHSYSIYINFLISTSARVNLKSYPSLKSRAALYLKYYMISSLTFLVCIISLGEFQQKFILSTFLSLI